MARLAGIPASVVAGASEAGARMEAKLEVCMLTYAFICPTAMEKRAKCVLRKARSLPSVIAECVALRRSPSEQELALGTLTLLPARLHQHDRESQLIPLVLCQGVLSRRTSSPAGCGTEQAVSHPPGAVPGRVCAAHEQPAGCGGD